MTNSRGPSCRLLRAGDPFTGKQGLQYAVGISAESAGSKGLHLQTVRCRRSPKPKRISTRRMKARSMC